MLPTIIINFSDARQREFRKKKDRDRKGEKKADRITRLKEKENLIEFHYQKKREKKKKIV